MSGILCVGHAVQDYVFRVRKLPDNAQKHQALDFVSIGGGPAANAAVTIARLGGEVKLAARIGNDPAGTAIVADLSEDGVDCSLVRRFKDGKSSLSAIMVDDDGQRMIVNYLDPKLPTATEWLEQSIPSDLDAVLVDTRWPEGALFALHHARRNNCLAILDADHPVPQDGKLVSTASHVAFSAQGLRAYADIDDLEDALNAVTTTIDGWCCVTDGENGVLIKDGEESYRINTPQVKVVDTLGAGDVWHGAFSYFLSTGSNEIEAVKKANAAAAIKVMRTGGRAGAPSLEDVKELLIAENIQ